MKIKSGTHYFIMLSPVKIWRNQKKVKKLLGLRGEITTWTKIYAPPFGYEAQAPYIVAIAKFTDGKSYIAQLVDWEEDNLKKGQKVKTILRKTKNADEESVIPYGIKFKPIK